jgi:thiamine biosynthesis lipoprotein
VLTTDPARIGEAYDAVRAEVDAIDAACSRFRPDSELSRVNQADGAPVPVSALFAEALETALRAAELTDGDVDPTCGAALEALGYDRDFDAVRAASAAGPTFVVTGFVPAPGWRVIDWDLERRVVRIPPGCRLDFGATAKALAADRAAARAHAASGCGVLVSLSGDISLSGPAPEGGWHVRVTDDHRSGDDAPGQTITLFEGGLATSSTTVRRWTASSPSSIPALEMHHIVEPAGGRPVESCWRTVSVAAATCVDANTAATAAIVRGQAVRAWLVGLRLPARLVRLDGSAVIVGGWPEDASGEQRASEGWRASEDQRAARNRPGSER